MAARIKEFAGQVSHADPGDLPDGASQSQVNVVTNVPGKLLVRPGLQPVTFGNDDASDTAQDVIGMYNYQHPRGDIIVFQLADGTVSGGRSVS